MLIRPIAVLTALALTMPAVAQTNPPKRVRSVTLTEPAQRCPESTADEVVVCARISPGEQFRIPKELRSEGPVPVENRSWAARTDRLDEVGREAGGLPNTCSPVGTGGATGCTQQLIERARADRRDGVTPPPR